MEMPPPKKVTLINPMTGGKMEGYLIRREILRSNSMIDRRFVPRHAVVSIFKNTKKMMQDKGFSIPISEGHPDENGMRINQRAMGWVQDIYLTSTAMRKQLFADIFYYPEAYKLFMDGQLPNVSGEYEGGGENAKGQAIGPYCSVVAMLGSDPPAQPWLLAWKQKGNPFMKMDFGSKVIYCSFNRGNTKKPLFVAGKQTKDIKSMTTDEKINSLLSLVEKQTKAMGKMQKKMDSMQAAMEEAKSEDDGTPHIDKLEAEMMKMGNLINPEKQPALHACYTNSMKHLDNHIADLEDPEEEEEKPEEPDSTDAKADINPIVALDDDDDDDDDEPEGEDDMKAQKARKAQRASQRAAAIAPAPAIASVKASKNTPSDAKINKAWTKLFYSGHVIEAAKGPFIAQSKKMGIQAAIQTFTSNGKRTDVPGMFGSQGNGGLGSNITGNSSAGKIFDAEQRTFMKKFTGKTDAELDKDEELLRKSGYKMMIPESAKNDPELLKKWQARAMSANGVA